MMGDSFKEFGVLIFIHVLQAKPHHHQTASDFFKTLYDKVFLQKKLEQYYDEEVNSF